MHFPTQYCPFWCVFAGVVLALVPMPVLAQVLQPTDTTTETTTEDVVVTGTLIPTLRSQAPVPVEVYTRAFLQRLPSQNLFEALQTINGVRPQLNCAVCNTGDIHINGLEGAYTLVTVDGMPIISALGTVYGLMSIPTELIERIEVVRGPAGATYGSEAMAGVINVITRNPATTPRLMAQASTSTWQEHQLNLGWRTTKGRISNMAGAGGVWYNTPTDRNGDGFTDLALAQRVSLWDKLRLERPNGKQASLMARYVYEDRWGGQLNWADAFRGGDSIYGESIRTSRWEVLGRYDVAIDSQTVSLTWSVNDHQQDAAYGTTVYDARQTIGFVQAIWPKQLGTRWQLTPGASVRYTVLDDNTPATATATGQNNPQHTFLPGVFAEAQYTSANTKHTLLGGLRGDHHPVHGIIPSPRVHYLWRASNQTQVRVGVGTGFRVVSVFTEDHAALTGARDVVFAEALNPERSANANAHLRHTFTHRKGFLNAEISTFFTRFSNQIVADLETNVQQIIYTNLNGYALNYGLNAGVDGTVNNVLTYNLGITLVQNELTENTPTGTERRFPLLTERASGSWGLTWNWNAAQLRLDYSGSVTGPMRLPVFPVADPRANRSPWFSVQHVQATRAFPKLNLEVFLAVKNLLNFRPAANSILRAHDPFDRTAADPTTNPNGHTFDPSYVYASFQGRRLEGGVRWRLP